MKNKGFTLIELVLTIALVSIIGTVALSILFITFRASKKSDVLIDLKQSGNTVISQVTRQIRYAKSLDETDPPPGPNPANPILCDGSDLSAITITSSLDNAQTIFSCIPDDLGTPVIDATIASNGASLVDVDTSSTNPVVVTYCSITCTQSTLNDPPTIRVNFTLSTPSSILPEASGNASFQTSVTMRNFSK